MLDDAPAGHTGGLRLVEHAMKWAVSPTTAKKGKQSAIISRFDV